MDFEESLLAKRKSMKQIFKEAEKGSLVLAFNSFLSLGKRFPRPEFHKEPLSPYNKFLLYA